MLETGGADVASPYWTHGTAIYWEAGSVVEIAGPSVGTILDGGKAPAPDKGASYVVALLCVKDRGAHGVERSGSAARLGSFVGAVAIEAEASAV